MNISFDISAVHFRLLKMGGIIAKILEKNDIPYIIAYGTLLGAVRHEGFIPWDDDFDFFLFDDSYDNAIEILRKEIPQDMFLEDSLSEPLYFHAWAHIKDLNSEISCDLYPQDNIYAHHGLTVDLYRCKRMNLAELCEYRKMEAELYLKRKLNRKLMSESDFQQQLSRLTKKIEDDEKGDANTNVDILGFPFNERYMKYSDVFPLKRYSFENVSFWGPNNADAILKQFYGDYMQLPPEKDRVPHCNNIIIR
ncbi:phosphorylcholine transferase LicD [Fibrobacter succinogenes]|uniref:LicD family protein n=1 Tax=Fibrobacter succinogenes TaxID=833 RepID=UPI0015690389|nr:LicD family protein [Fibrobacter succinogenes]